MDKLGLLECCDLSGSGDWKPFEESTLMSLASFRFEPAQRDGVPLDIDYTFKINFVYP
jgi:hypothetical protein